MRYDYRCETCGNEQEAMRSIASRRSPLLCDSCGGECTLAVSAVAIRKSVSRSLPHWMGPPRLDDKGRVVTDDTTEHVVREYNDKLFENTPSYTGVDAKREKAELHEARVMYEGLLNNPEKRRAIIAEAERKSANV